MLNLNPGEHIASDYLNQCFTDLPSVVKQAVKNLKPFTDRFEGIVVRGTSGLLVGPMVAATLKKPWSIVRKSGDGTHSDHKTVEGWFGFETYIIIDDLVSSGGTLRMIQHQMLHYARDEGHTLPSCVGFYLYNHGELRWRGDVNTPSYYDQYFLFPEIFKRPAVSEQIFTYVSPRPLACGPTS